MRAGRRSSASSRRASLGVGLAGDGDPPSGRRTASSAPAPSASSTATTARRCSTSRSASPTAGGAGYGAEATALMLDHAFGALGLHRVALAVFEFNERAIRAYQKVGFAIEGRLARGDLARRPLLGRDPDEHPRGRVAERAGSRWRWRPAARAGAGGESRPLTIRTGRLRSNADDRADPLSVASRGPRPTRPGRRSRSDGGEGPRGGQRPGRGGGPRGRVRGRGLQRTPPLDAMLQRPRRRTGADGAGKAGRQDRRGRPIHPPRDLARARQRLRVIAWLAPAGRPGVVRELARLGRGPRRPWTVAVRP